MTRKKKLSMPVKISLILGAILFIVLLIVLLCNCKGEHYKKEKDTIFVSIASYRDNQCKDTIKDLFAKAKNPNRIVLGICDQSKEKDEACMVKKYKKHIRLLKLDPKEAKGPLYARSLITPLYFNEDYFLMIDSHTVFDKDWDENLVNQIKELQMKTKKKKVIISSYPKHKGDRNNNFNFSLCKTINLTGGYPAQFDSVVKRNGNVFKQQMFIAGGFLFTIGKFIHDVRFTGSLDGIFNGEEILLSYYAYCKGYDIFSQKRNVLYHNYSQEGRNIYSEDNKKQLQSEEKSREKLKYLLFQENIECVDGRSREKFWKIIGWDHQKKQIDKKVENYWCNDSKEY